MKKQLWLAALALLLTLSLILCACGGQASGETTAATNGLTTEATQTSQLVTEPLPEGTVTVPHPTTQFIDIDPLEPPIESTGTRETEPTLDWNTLPNFGNWDSNELPEDRP